MAAPAPDLLVDGAEEEEVVPAGGLLAAAPAPVPVAANARRAREEIVADLKLRRDNLKKEQKRLASQLKKDTREHQRAVKKMKTLPTPAILQCLRERGVDV